MQPLGKYPYLDKSKRQIRKEALIHLLLSPLMLVLCIMSVVGLFYFPSFIIESLKELFIPNRLINKSKNDLARDMGKNQFMTFFHQASTKQREKFRK